MGGGQGVREKVFIVGHVVVVVGAVFNLSVQGKHALHSVRQETLKLQCGPYPD